MVKFGLNNISNDYGGSSSKGNYDYELALFVKKFIEFSFEYFGISQKIKGTGRPPHKLLHVMQLLVYGAVNGIIGTDEIASLAEYHELYKMVSNHLFISGRSLRDYRKEYRDLFEKILSLTLIFAYFMNFTDFYHIAVDGTIKKAFNSPFNILKMDDIDILIRHFTVKPLEKEEIKNLRDSAVKYLYSENLTDHEKLEVLKILKDILEKSGQKSIRINDETARWMYNKQHRAQISHNVQHAVDIKTTLICGIHVSDSPTDHYLIPPLMDRVLKNIPIDKPRFISANTIYRTIPNLTYINNIGSIPLIPTRKQGKLSINNLNADPFSIDYFTFDFEKRVVICPNNETLKEYGPYDCEPDKFGFKRKQYTYSNYRAYQKCPYKKECCKNSTHRTITRYGHELLDECEQIMEKEENQLEHKNRNRVEAPNGPYKTYFHFNDLAIVGIDNINCIMNDIGVAYNLKILFNIIMKKEIKMEDVYKVMKILTEPTTNFLCNMGMLQN